jgi:hypothetical protein
MTMQVDGVIVVHHPPTATFMACLFLFFRLSHAATEPVIAITATE